MAVDSQRPTMTLETMQPNPAWSADAHAEAVGTFGSLADRLTVRVWAGDWCPDCRNQLPDFAAAMNAAGLLDAVEQYPVEKVDGEKVGPGMEEYGVEYIPTVVVELDGEEVTRYVEQEDRPIAVWLAARLDELEVEV